ncbi:MAG: pyridoxal phosphate-dependent aminotransferase [Anaeroplasmataceae bacterium]
MSLLCKESVGKENKGSALTIGKEAREAKALDKTVIDSTIGMLFDENGKFYTFPMVENIISKLSAREKFGYGSTAGDPKFQEAIKAWVFRNYKDEIESKMNCRVVATPGGTGAIYSTVSNYLSPGQKVLIPNYMWTNYTQIARQALVGYETYNMFDENGDFDLNDIKKKCIELKKTQERIVIIINDPCQNPTGYSMKYTEWMELVQIINDISRDGTPFVLLYDMAYIDYDRRGFDASRRNINLLTNLNENAIAVLAFSGSKTLGLYGLRIGAQVAMTKNASYANEFYAAAEFTGRGIWSGSSVLGMNVISEVLTNHKEAFEKELKEASDLLIKRANTFIEEASKQGVKSLPYECGFFVTIPCENPKAVFEELKKKGVYIIPMSNAIRVTLSSISTDEIVRLVAILKSVL